MDIDKVNDFRKMVSESSDKDLSDFLGLISDLSNIVFDEIKKESDKDFNSKLELIETLWKNEKEKQMFLK